ncbi:MAG: TOBE domain-containing protein, partial [Gemmatimonadaceae bacterium]
ADRVAFLSDGKLRQVGTPETLYDAPATRAVAEFIGHASLMDALFDGTNASITHGEQTITVPAIAATGITREALAVVRPEAMQIVADAATANGWSGRVVSRRFLGGTSAYRVTLADNFNLEATSDDRSFNEGDAVRISITRAPVALVAR